MIASIQHTLSNEKGFVLVLVILMLAIVTVIGIAATRTSDTEMQIAANERSRANEFYDAEGGLIDTIERSGNWLTDDFLTAGETTAAYRNPNVDIDGNGTPDAIVEVRCIESTGTPDTGGVLSDVANNFPLQVHIAPPPLGSGYSTKYFEVRRYAVTSTSESGNTQLQAGVWKIFNKF